MSEPPSKKSRVEAQLSETTATTTVLKMSNNNKISAIKKLIASGSSDDKIEEFILSTYKSKLPIRKMAPDWKAEAVMPNKEIKSISLSDYKGKWVVFFWYPLDFTFVCPTEIIAFGDRQPEFSAINTQVIAASCDSKFSHLAWVNTPRSEGGLGEMKIPIIADFDKSIANDYGVLIEGGGDDTVPLRALFIISPTGVIRQITCNDLPVGRNVDEIIRLIQAFQYTDTHGEVCPANWQPGDITMVADPTKSKEYFNKVNK